MFTELKVYELKFNRYIKTMSLLHWIMWDVSKPRDPMLPRSLDYIQEEDLYYNNMYAFCQIYNLSKCIM